MVEKGFFHLLNVAMVNSFIFYCKWVQSCDAPKVELRKVMQTEFGTQVIKRMIAKSGDKITPPCIPKCTSAPSLEIQRLTGRHLIQKIIVDRQKTLLVDHAKFVFWWNAKRTNEMVLNANVLGMKVVMNVVMVV